jgi:hypothetical protein
MTSEVVENTDELSFGEAQLEFLLWTGTGTAQFKMAGAFFQISN